MTLRSRLSLLEKRIPSRGRSGCVRCDAPERPWRRVLVLFEGSREHRCDLCGRRVDERGNPLGPTYATVIRVEGLQEEPREP